MSSNTINYVEPYPVVAIGAAALFLMYQPSSQIVFPQDVSSNVTPCQPNVQSFNNVNSVKELPPCQPTLKSLARAQYSLYPSVNDF